MSATEAPAEVVYCNQCGTANPSRSAICCSCGHVHARTMETVEAKPGITLEQWFWIVLRIVLGVAICIGRAVPMSGVEISPALLGSVFGSIAIPVAIGVVLGNGNWAKSSRWFLGAALLLPVAHYVGTVLARIRWH